MRNSFQFPAPGFQRGLLPLAIVLVTLSILSASQLIPRTRAQRRRRCRPPLRVRMRQARRVLFIPRAKGRHR